MKLSSVNKVSFQFSHCLVSTEIPPEEVVRDEPEEIDTEDHIWFWQEEFKPVVSKLALSISETIQSETRTALQKEMQAYEKSHWNYEAVDITGLHYSQIIIFIKMTLTFNFINIYFIILETYDQLGETVDYPKMISKVEL